MDTPTTDLTVDQLDKIDPTKMRGGKRAGAGTKKGSGGFRVGSGRPKGRKSEKTILREEAAKELALKGMYKKEIMAMLPPKLQRSEKALKAAIAELNSDDIEKTFKNRVALHSNKLLTALLTAAMGEQFLYKVVYAIDEKDGKVKTRHVRVTDAEEIQSYLDNPTDVEGSDYYYISTKSPDITAINSLLDRFMGRPTTKVVGPNNPDGSEGAIRVITMNYSATPPPVQPATEAIVSEVIHEAIEEKND